MSNEKLSQHEAAIAAERQRAERAETALLHELKTRTARPDFATFCELKHGPVGAILWALQNGEISRGKAAEALAEWAHGIEPQLPELPDEIPDDVVPLDLLRKRDEAREKVEDLEAELDEAQSTLEIVTNRLKDQTEEFEVARAQLAAAQEETERLRAALDTIDDIASGICGTASDHESAGEIRTVVLSALAPQPTAPAKAAAEQEAPFTK